MACRLKQCPWSSCKSSPLKQTFGGSGVGATVEDARTLWTSNFAHPSDKGLSPQCSFWIPFSSAENKRQRKRQSNSLTLTQMGSLSPDLRPQSPPTQGEMAEGPSARNRAVAQAACEPHALPGSGRSSCSGISLFFNLTPQRGSRPRGAAKTRTKHQY